MSLNLKCPASLSALILLATLSNSAAQTSAPPVRWTPGNSVTIKPVYRPNIPTSPGALDPRGARAGEQMETVKEFLDGPGGEMIAWGRKIEADRRAAKEQAKQTEAWKSVGELKSLETLPTPGPDALAYRAVFQEVLENASKDRALNPAKYVGQQFVNPPPASTCPTSIRDLPKYDGPTMRAAPEDHEAELKKIIRNNPELRRKYLEDPATSERILRRAEFEDNAYKNNQDDTSKAVAEIQADEIRRLRLKEMIRAEEAAAEEAAAEDDDSSSELRAPDSELNIETSSIGDFEETIPHHGGRLHPIRDDE